MDVQKQQTVKRKIPLAERFSREIGRRKGDKLALLRDAGYLLLGVIFARAHLFFGAYPLGLALLAVLPADVGVALLGVIGGSLSLGQPGIVFAMAAVVTVLLRFVVSGQAGRERGEFSENLLLRMSSAVIGGFVTAVYEMLLSGLSLSSVMFALSMILSPALFAFGFSGVFDGGVSLGDLIAGKEDLLHLPRRTPKATGDLIFFEGSFLLLCFFVGLSLGGYRLLGISFGYIYAAALSLLVAKRFGALPAMATGFVAAVGLSGTAAVSFALAGLAAGLLFPIGAGYALTLGGAALAAYSFYVGGAADLFATLPEYALAALAAFPIARRLKAVEKKKEEPIPAGKVATDMVGTMALSYKNRGPDAFATLEETATAIAASMKKIGAREGEPSEEDYAATCLACAEAHCRSCDGFAACTTTRKDPYGEVAHALAKKLAGREEIGMADMEAAPLYCPQKEKILDGIQHGAALLREEKFKTKKIEGIAEQYEVMAKLLAKEREKEAGRVRLDEDATEKAGAVFTREFPDGILRVFGERKKTLIAACEDAEGTRVTSPKLKADLEAALGLPLGAPSFFRKEEMVLLECVAGRGYTATAATAALPAIDGEISGDSTRTGEVDDRFYTVLSDGMGSGKVARESADFTVDFLTRVPGFDTAGGSLLHTLNRVLRERGEECSATVDLFSMDLYTGEALFLKSGAVPSYIKRGESIFRIRSETAPLGLLSSVDAERIRVDVEPGDVVVLLSDGISSSPEDAPWLLEMLGKPLARTPREVADDLLAAAVKENGRRDDMTVTVVKIGKCAA